jgi:tetratricopeptide (TPR) repeat protein
MTNYLKNAFFFSLLLVNATLFAQTDLRLAMQTDNWKDAVMTLEGLIKKNPADVASFMRLGSAYQALGQNDKAKAAYSSAAAADPKSKYMSTIELRQAIQMGDEAAIQKALKKAEKSARGKDAFEVYRFIGESFLYGGKKNYVEAEKWLKESYTAKPKDIETLMQLGYAYKSMTNRLGDAVTHYEYASNLNGVDPLPYYLSAKAYFIARMPVKYEEYLKKALAAEPTYVPALRDLADQYYFTRKYELAKPAYEDLIKNQGDNVNIEDEMQYSNTLFILKDYDGTVKQVNKIIGKDGSKNYLRRLLGYTYFEKGDTDKGLEIMRDYFIKVSPEKIIARDYEYYGKMLAAKKEDSLALFNLTKAIDMDSSLWQVYNDIGKIKYGKGQYLEASQAWQIRIDSLKEDVTATDLYFVGLAHHYAYTRQGNDPARLADAEKAFTAITVRAPKAGVGWYWLAKTLALSDPDIVADPTKVAEFGKAEVAFTKYVEIASAEAEKNKKELIPAYQYLAYLQITKGNTPAGCAHLNSILAIDATNASALEYKTEAGCQ